MKNLIIGLSLLGSVISFAEDYKLFYKGMEFDTASYGVVATFGDCLDRNSNYKISLLGKNSDESEIKYSLTGDAGEKGEEIIWACGDASGAKSVENRVIQVYKSYPFDR